MTKAGFTTQLVHADRTLNKPEQGAVHFSSTNSVLFEFSDAQDIINVFQGKQPGHVYGRSSTPSIAALQNMLTELEGGVGTACFATGMAAIASSLLALFKHGDHLIVSQYLFGNTRSFMGTLSDMGIEISFVDVTDIEAVKDAHQSNTKAVFCESIANPVTQVADLRAIGQFCREENMLFLLDSTMTPPPVCDVKAHGVSLVFHSLTKYIAGHGNVLGGAVIDTGLFDWTGFEHIKPAYRVADTTQWGLTQIRKKGLRDIGATLSPDCAAKIAVGMETLGLRIERSGTNALKLASYLESAAGIDTVYYPGLADHPQHFTAREQLNGYGSILSLDLAPGIDPVAFLNQLQRVVCATHLGDNRTLALPVAPTIFFENGEVERARMGITETMIRVSVGIEDIDDLVADFQQALASFGY